MIETRNPFKPVKFEDEERPLLYVSEEAKRQFEHGNFYFTGKRGCGKTTCLKIADTEFQLKDSASNQSLYDSLARKTLGVYLNLNNRVIPDFEGMIPGANKTLSKSVAAKEQLTSEFIELLILRATLNTLVRLARRSRILLTQRDEEQLCAATTTPYKLLAAENIDVLLISIEQRLIKMIDASRGIGEPLAFESRLEISFHPVMAGIIECLRRNNDVSLIRILIDDGEVFGPAYQRALNTLVRTPQGLPVCWSIAYVLGKFDPKNTTINNQTLGREERTVIYLDNQESDKYRKFYTEVIRLRVERATKVYTDFLVNMKLSHFDTNTLALSSLQNTTKSRAIKFIERASLRGNKTGNTSGAPPFYEQHLRERGFEEHTLTRDALRRKNVASYISLCRRYGVQPKYAGERVVSALSDGCIRDFLEMMSSIYEVTKCDKNNLDFFSSNPLPVDIQDEGCRDASTRKLISIRDYTERHGLLLEKLVRFIGTLAHLIQTNQDTPEPLRNPERSIFGVLLGDQYSTHREFQLIKDGEVDGYLRHVDVDLPHKTRPYCFRLHRQFAPEFNISYRESYDYIFEIPTHQLRHILDVETTDPRLWADRVYRDWQAKKGLGPSFFDDRES
ncbi:hypothetical protein [Rhodopseudomonas palustris]|uniref:ORC-CDC6 family AAA ATPase n=1 Tax=Rhodopseudomonas palustris TaxID=1076 RepID=UPI001057D205|nr:hypothetical protein [Rhodopseudomonas palustris]